MKKGTNKNQSIDLHQQAQGEVQYLHFDFFNHYKWKRLPKRKPEPKTITVLKKTAKWYLIAQVLGIAFFLQTLNSINVWSHSTNSDTQLSILNQALLEQQDITTIYSVFQKSLASNDFITHINSLRAIVAILNDKPVHLDFIAPPNKVHNTNTPEAYKNDFIATHHYTMEEKAMLASLALSSDYTYYEQDEALEQQITDHCGPLGINSNFFLACYALHSTTPGQDRMNHENNEQNIMTQVQQWVHTNADTIHASDSLTEILGGVLSHTRSGASTANTLPEKTNLNPNSIDYPSVR
jgi:hypothetical protein